MDDKYLSKIAAMLRQAETTENEHEAQAFMQAAQRLATATQIDLEIARQHQKNKEKRETPIQKRIAIGDRGKKGLKYYVRLFLAIAGQNGITCDMASNSTAVYAFGFPSDIEMVELLYASLVSQMIEASDKYLRSAAYKQETVERWNDAKWRYETKPVDGRVARASFQEAFISTITSRLYKARLDAITEIKADEPESAESSTDIVLRNKEIEVRDYYKQASTASGSWGGYKGSSGHSTHASGAGREAGQRARIGGNRAIGGGQGQIKGG